MAHERRCAQLGICRSAPLSPLTNDDNDHERDGRCDEGEDGNPCCRAISVSTVVRTVMAVTYPGFPTAPKLVDPVAQGHGVGVSCTIGEDCIIGEDERFALWVAVSNSTAADMNSNTHLLRIPDEQGAICVGQIVLVRCVFDAEGHALTSFRE
jgi:hypothetical protein